MYVRRPVPEPPSGLGQSRPAAAPPVRPALAALLLLLALAAATLLRHHGLAARPLWVDEGATVAIARLPWATIRDLVFRVEANPPGYYALMKLWLDFGGGGGEAVWMRVPPLLAGVAALVPAYLFCRRAFGAWPALATAALLAVSAQHVRFSQEARNYALLFLLFACGLCLAQAMVRPRPGSDAPWRGRWARAVPLAAVTGGLIWLHATGLVVGACLYVYAGVALLAGGRARAATLAPLAAAGLGGLLLALPWIEVALRLATDPATAFSWPLPLTAGRATGVAREALLAPALYKLALPAAALVSALLGVALVRHGRRPQVVALAAALGFGLAALLAISLRTPVFLERTLLFAQLPLLALAGLGLATVAGWRPARAPPAGRALALAVLAVLVGMQLRAIQRFEGRDRYGEPWPAVAARLEAAAPYDVLVPIGVFEAATLREYAAPAVRALPQVLLLLGHEASFDRLAAAMLAPAAVLERLPDDLSCALPGRAAGTGMATGAVWLLDRVGASRRVKIDAVAALEAAGGVRTGQDLLENLILERWVLPPCADPPRG